MKPQDIEDLKQLIDFLKANQVAEFDLDRGDLKIRLKFEQQGGSVANLNDLSRLLASAPPSVATPSEPMRLAAALPSAVKAAVTVTD